MRARRVAVGEVRAPDSDASGAFTAKICWRLYAERLVAPKRRKIPGAFMPKTVWLLNGESSQGRTVTEERHTHRANLLGLHLYRRDELRAVLLGPRCCTACRESEQDYACRDSSK